MPRRAGASAAGVPGLPGGYGSPMERVGRRGAGTAPPA